MGNQGSSSGSTISVDFDGVIHRYSRGWQDGEIYDEPVEGAADGLTSLQEAGYRIVVSTAHPDVEGVALWIKDRLDMLLPVTNTKPVAAAYLDDRAVRFVNWELAVEELNEFLNGGTRRAGSNEARARLAAAVIKLVSLAATHPEGSAERQRLIGKAEGVRLALSYLREPV